MSNFEALTKHLDDFFTSDQSLDLMGKVSSLISSFDSIPPQITDKFYSFINPYDASKLANVLLLSEYLTIHCHENFFQFVKDDIFFDNFLHSLSHDELVEEALNILKLWTIVYKKKMDEIENVFSYIEGLEAFDIHLPKEYKPRFETSVPNASGEGRKEKDSNFEEKLNNEIAEANKLIEDTKNFLNDEKIRLWPKLNQHSLCNELISKNFSLQIGFMNYFRKSAELSLEIQTKIYLTTEELKEINELANARNNELLPIANEDDYDNGSNHNEIGDNDNNDKMEVEYDNFFYNCDDQEAFQKIAELDSLPLAIGGQIIQKGQQIMMPFNAKDHQNIIHEKENEKDVEKEIPQECKGKLHSKLIVRKSYDSPNVFTDIFRRNPCFNGFSFLRNEENITREKRICSQEQEKPENKNKN